MIEDSVVQEVRAARDAYAKSLGYDIRAMVADLRARDDGGDWPVVRLAARRPVNREAVVDELIIVSRDVGQLPGEVEGSPR